MNGSYLNLPYAAGGPPHSAGGALYSSPNPFTPIFFIVVIVLTVIAVIGMWKMYVKAGYAGWKAIIPFYNIYILLKIAGKPGWWLILLLIPYVNIAVWLFVAIKLAKAFGKSVAFGIIGLWLFNFVGFPILGFGDAKYTAPKVKSK